MKGREERKTSRLLVKGRSSYLVVKGSERHRSWHRQPTLWGKRDLGDLVHGRRKEGKKNGEIEWFCGLLKLKCLS